MAYQVILPKPVQKQIDALPGKERERVLERLKGLEANPRSHGAVKLKGSANEYRVRAGDYRVRYEIHDDKLIVLLLHCAHRREVYR